MGAPTLVTSSPEASELSVYRNKIITATFSEALDPDTVHSGTVVLRNVDTNEVLGVAVQLSEDGTVITVVPPKYLLADTAYVLLLVGEDVGGADGAIESSSTNDELATTAQIPFSVGSDFEAETAHKTQAQIDEEGDLSLPNDVQVIEDQSYLEIVSTSPQNHEINIASDDGRIIVTFDGELDTSTVNEGTFQVSVEPYYPEDEFFLARPDADGNPNFQFQERTDENGDPLDYTDPVGSFEIVNNKIVWSADENETFPENSKVVVSMSSEIADVNGRTLNGNRFFTFYVVMCPFVVSVETLRDALYPVPLGDWTDDLLLKTIYKNVFELLPIIRWCVRTDRIHAQIRRYVLNKSVDDIYRAAQAVSDLQAGQFRKLGDLMIRYDVRSADMMPQAQRKAIAAWQAALAELTRFYYEAPRPFIRGYFHPEQRQYWRNRVWQIDVARAYQGSTAVGEIQGNTRLHRSTKVAGFLDSWR